MLCLKRIALAVSLGTAAIRAGVCPGDVQLPAVPQSRAMAPGERAIKQAQNLRTCNLVEAGVGGDL